MSINGALHVVSGDPDWDMSMYVVAESHAYPTIHDAVDTHTQNRVKVERTPETNRGKSAVQPAASIAVPGATG